MSNLITGLFDTPAAAQAAVSLLQQNGYSSNEISVIIKDAAEQAKEGSVVVAVAAHPGDEERVHSALQNRAAAGGPVTLAHVAPLSALSVSPMPRQEHTPIRIPILDEIRAEQMAAVEHERDARREALLASPLSHDEAAAPAHPAFTGLEHTSKTP